MLSGFPVDNSILEHKIKAWSMKADGDVQALSKVSKIWGSGGWSFTKEDL